MHTLEQKNNSSMNKKLITSLKNTSSAQNLYQTQFEHMQKEKLTKKISKRFDIIDKSRIKELNTQSNNNEIVHQNQKSSMVNNYIKDRANGSRLTASFSRNLWANMNGLKQSSSQGHLFKTGSASISLWDDNSHMNWLNLNTQIISNQEEHDMSNSQTITEINQSDLGEIKLEEVDKRGKVHSLAYWDML